VGVGHASQSRGDTLKRGLKRVEKSRMSFKVMIADDEDQLREVMRRHLSRGGSWEILQAANGPETVLLAEDEKPDVVILDYLMPGMTGEEIANELRNRVPEIKIIACSSVVISKPYWADAYLDKSNLADVNRVISEAVGTTEESASA
jgi:CheY-like chemotaxis protein